MTSFVIDVTSFVMLVVAIVRDRVRPWFSGWCRLSLGVVLGHVCFTGVPRAFVGRDRRTATLVPGKVFHGLFHGGCFTVGVSRTIVSER